MDIKLPLAFSTAAVIAANLSAAWLAAVHILGSTTRRSFFHLRYKVRLTGEEEAAATRARA